MLRVILSHSIDRFIQRWMNWLKQWMMFSIISSRFFVSSIPSSYMNISCSIKTTIGFGVGVGANILTRFAVRTWFFVITDQDCSISLLFSWSIHRKSMGLFRSIVFHVELVGSMVWLLKYEDFFDQNFSYLNSSFPSGQHRICLNKHGQIHF